MKVIYAPITRIIPALLIGVIMVLFPHQALHYIAILLGLLLLIPGVIQLVRYTIAHTKRSRRLRRNSTITFPIIATIFSLIGIAILCFPAQTATLAMYLLGAALVFAGAYEILFLALRKQHIHTLYYVIPILLVVVGVFLLINPLAIAEQIVVRIFGISIILHAIIEIIYFIKFRI